MKLTYSTPKSHFCLLSLMFWLERRHLEEHQSQHGKYHRLDEPHEHLEEHKRQGQKIGYQVEHDSEEDFPRKDVPKETKGKGDNLAYLRDELENPDRRPDTIRLVERTDQELFAILHDSESSDPGKLY